MNSQGEYWLRFTGNYTDQMFGVGKHEQLIPFHEFLGKAESAFMYLPTYMQIPGYIPSEVGVQPVEEAARQYVANYIMNEFEHMLLGMEDYVRWAKLFENKCADVSQAFWSQVNMISLMTAAELEMDETHGTNTSLGTGVRTGEQTTTSTGEGTSSTTGQVKTVQDSDTSQSTDNVSRDATATTVSAEDQLTEEVQYDWTHAADNVHETRSRSGDSNVHMESTVDSTSTTNSTQQSNSSTQFGNIQDENQNTITSEQNYTNKMFMQERQWAIDTARTLLPLEWLRQQLRPMFYMLY